MPQTTISKVTCQDRGEYRVLRHASTHVWPALWKASWRRWILYRMNMESWEWVLRHKQLCVSGEARDWGHTPVRLAAGWTNEPAAKLGSHPEDICLTQRYCAYENLPISWPPCGEERVKPALTSRSSLTDYCHGNRQQLHSSRPLLPAL